MKGSDVRGLRRRRKWSQAQLIELVNRALGTNYSRRRVGDWEAEKYALPEGVGEFLDRLEIEEAAASLQPDYEPPHDYQLADEQDELLAGIRSGAAADPGPAPTEDDPPPPPPGARAGQPALPGGDPALARVCTELWELIATGTGMIGAVTGSSALQRDGEIIYEDRLALGRAWAKLAETNATFRRMLLASTTSGAWLEVAMVSGITFGKCARNHQAIAAERKAAGENAETEFARMQAEAAVRDGMATAGAGVEGGFVGDQSREAA